MSAVTIYREAGWLIGWHDHGIGGWTLGDADLLEEYSVTMLRLVLIYY